MHPFFLLMAMLGIGSGLLSLYRRYPESAAVLFILSSLGLFIRAWQLTHKEERAADPTSRIRFETLRGVDILRYRDWLKENVRGHDRVIDEVLTELQQDLALAGPKRTLGAYLLVGPMGTGKRFLAELVGKALYPESKALVLKMGDHRDAEADAGRAGRADGRSVSGFAGALTAPVLEDPRRLVLLDELERCHPAVQDCLSAILTTTQYPDRESGETAHFNACAFFATCTTGVERLRQLAASVSDPAARRERLRDSLSAAGILPKSLLVLFDGVWLMDELSPMHTAEVVCLQLAKHWREYGIELSYTSPEFIMEAMRRNAGFKEYGVRQLARLIQTMTDDAIEKARLGGASRIRLDYDRASGRIDVVLLDGR